MYRSVSLTRSVPPYTLFPFASPCEEFPFCEFPQDKNRKETAGKKNLKECKTVMKKLKTQAGQKCKLLAWFMDAERNKKFAF